MAINPVTGVDDTIKTNPNAGGAVKDTSPGDVLPRTDANQVNSAPSVISPDNVAPISASSSMTGAISDKGAYNPTTGGYESIAPTVGVNTGQFSPEAKQTEWEKQGKTGAYDPNAFERGTSGGLQMKGAGTDVLSVTAKPAAEIDMPAAEKITQLDTPQYPNPDPSKPHSQGDVWNPTTGNWELPPADPAIKALEGIYDANNLSSDERKWYNDNVFNNADERKKFLAMTDQERLKYFTDIRDANRATRDANLAAEQRQSAYNSNVEMQKSQFASQNAKMLDSIAADAQNMAMVAGTSGRLQSRQLQTNISNQLKLNQDIYNNLLGYQDQYMTALKNEFEYKNAAASNEYNDTMGSIKKDLQDKISALQATGAMNTKSGLLQAQSFIDQATSNGANAMSQYNYNLQVAGERVKTMADAMREQNKYDDNVTKQMADGFLYTAQGTKMMDNQGKPLKINNSNGTLLSKEPIDLADGSKGMIFQNADGTTRVEKLVGTTPATVMDATQVKNLATALSNGTIDSATLKMLPSSVQAQVLAQINPAMASNKNIDFGKIGTDADGNDIMGFIDKVNRTTTPLSSYAGGGQTTGGSIPLASIASTPDNTQMKQGQRGYWCGEFVNDALAGTGAKKFGDSLESKKALIDGQPPVVGSAVIMSLPGKYAENGHVGIIMGTDGNGNLLMKSSNFDGTHKITTDAISPNDPKILGFYTPKVNLSANDEYAQVASDLINGTTKTSDLKTLGYTKTQIKQIQDLRLGLQKNQESKTQDSTKAQLLSLYTSAPERLTSMGISNGQLTKNQIKQALFEKGVSAEDFSGGIEADKYLAKADATAFGHLNMLRQLVEKLPNTQTKLDAAIVNKVLDFFGNPTQANQEMMGGLAGDELAKFYGGTGVSDRQAAGQYFGSLPKETMLARIKQAQDASSTKAYMENQKYSAITGTDHGTYKQIQKTIKDGLTGEESVNTPAASALGAPNTGAKGYAGIGGPTFGTSTAGIGSADSGVDYSKYSLPSGSSTGIGNIPTSSTPSLDYKKYFQ